MRCIVNGVFCCRFCLPLNETAGFKTNSKCLCKSFLDETGVKCFSLRLCLLCFLKVEKAQPRPGRRKPPPVIFASLGLSATWMQRMFGEFEQRDKPPVGLSEHGSAPDNVCLLKRWLKGG